MSEQKEKPSVPKNVLKKWGRQAQDLVGFFEMGTNQFFNVTVEGGNGDWAIVDYAIEVYHEHCDPEAEDRRGGSAHLAKIFMSNNDDEVIFHCHVPEEIKDKATAKEWLGYVIEQLEGAVEFIGEPTDTTARAVGKKNPEKNFFPGKLLDAAISHSCNFLRKRALFPEDDDSGDDDHNYAVCIFSPLYFYSSSVCSPMPASFCCF